MYKVVFSNKAKKSLTKLDKQVASMIVRWIKVNLDGCENPRLYGHALRGKFEGCWTYRIGSYRAICRIENNQLKIIALSIGHRRDIYK